MSSVTPSHPSGADHDPDRSETRMSARGLWLNAGVRRTLFALAVVLTLSAVALAQPATQTTDFGNFVYPWSDRFDRGLASVSGWRWMDTRNTRVLVLRNGSHDFGNGAGLLLLSSVTYGDLDGDGRDEAAVDLIRTSGGTANWHYLYVFRTVESVARPMAILRSGSRADGGLTSVAINKGLLILEFNDPEMRTADCCSDGFIRVQYRYDDARFIETAPRAKGARQQ
jgi:hypothetical protein